MKNNQQKNKVDKDLQIMNVVTKRKTDMQRFIGKYHPSKYKVLKNGIDVRSVNDLNGAMNKARELINDLRLGLVVIHNADMAANRSFEVREVLS